MRLRRPKSSESGEEQRNNGCRSPTHGVIAKEPNIDVIDSEIQWLAQYEQKDKTIHPVRHPRYSLAKDEGCSYQNCETNYRSKNELHSVWVKARRCGLMVSRLRSIKGSKSDGWRNIPFHSSRRSASIRKFPRRATSSVSKPHNGRRHLNCHYGSGSLSVVPAL